MWSAGDVKVNKSLDLIDILILKLQTIDHDQDMFIMAMVNYITGIIQNVIL